MKHLFLLVFISLLCVCIDANALYIKGNEFSELDVDSVEQIATTEKAIALINYYINIASSLEQSPSIEFCENKRNEILNNLKKGQFGNIPELKKALDGLKEALLDVEINEMDRAVYMQLTQLKRKNQSLQAVGNALSTPMSIFNGPSAGLNTILTLARAGVDLAVAKREQEIEDKEAMWSFDKNNKETIGRLINDIHSAASNYASFNSYSRNFPEKAILNPTTAKEYNTTLADSRVRDMVNFLENQDNYKVLYDYDYHLGMGYIDLGEYDKAKMHFNSFLAKSHNSIFIVDSKIGMVAMTRLLYEQTSINENEALYLIKKMIGTSNDEGHLAYNDMAYIVASMTYLSMAERFDDLSYEKKAYKCIYDGLLKMYNNNLSDASLVASVMGSLDKIKTTDPVLHKDICECILSHRNSLTVTERLCLLYSLGGSYIKEHLPEMFVLDRQKEDNVLSFYLKPQKGNLSMDTVYVYDFSFDYLNRPKVSEYTRLLRGKSKKEINDSLKGALTNARFKYFFTKVNPNDKKSGYCLLPGFNREDYLPGGKFESKMIDIYLIKIINGNLEGTNELKYILDYCEKNMSDFTKLECKENLNSSRYKEAVEKYKETERRPIIEVSFWEYLWGATDYTIQDKERNLSEYRSLINKYKYKEEGEFYFWGDELVYTPSIKNLKSLTPYIQIVIGKSTPTQIVLTYTKKDLKLVSCQQGGNYHRFE
ncbi:MAG: hypothetical protein J6V12_08625 [Bacteroidaceae bacterium]|nr:hypothetical protein [Bacteroidaceae bacterium]